MAVLASHQPLDGLSQYTALSTLSTLSRLNTTAEDSAQQRLRAGSGDVRLRDEQKQKAVWDGEHTEHLEKDDTDEAAGADGGSAVTEGLSAASEAQVSGISLSSDSAQHSAHRERDVLQSSWSNACGSSAVLSVWDECFASSFHTRCQELVHASFSRFKFHETIERALEHWSDGAGRDSALIEPAASAVWSAAAVSSMWSGYRQTAVTALVSSFALQLERLAADIRHLLDCPLADTVRQATTQQANAAALSSSAAGAGSSPLLYPFDYLSFLSLPRFLDDELSPSLHRLYTASVHSMAEQLKRRLAALDHSVLTLMASESSWRSDECRMLVERAVFIGRCCASITQQTAFASFSQALQQPSAVQQLYSSSFTAQPSSSFTSAPSTVSPSPAAASSLSSSSSPIVAALSSTARSAFRIWSRFVAATVSDEMETSLSAWRKAATSTQRQRSAAADSVYNQTLTNQNPETHASGVPSQPSAYIHRVLWTVQQHTYTTHGYQTPSEVLKWMIQDTAIAVTAVVQAQMDSIDDSSSRHTISHGDDDTTTAQHGQLSQQPPRQASMAAPFAAMPLSALLQLYFDLLFLLSMLRLPSDVPSQKAATANEYHPSGLAVLLSVESALAGRVTAAADWPKLRASVVLSCLVCLQRNQLLFGLLAKRNPLPPLQIIGGLDEPHIATTATTAATTTTMLPTATAYTSPSTAAPTATPTPSSVSGAAGSSTAASGLALASTSSRIMSFSTSFYTHSNSAARQLQLQRPQQQQQTPQQQQRAVSGNHTQLFRSPVSAVSVAVAATAGPSSSSSVAANAASVASESAALLKQKGRELLGKWNLV